MVGDTSKDAGNKLGIIRVTEAPEHLVLRRGIEIDANVKGVLVFVESWAVGEVVGETTVCGHGVKIHQFDGVRIQACGRKLIQAAAGKRIDGRAWPARSERIANET
jgi:hypothetical protein